MSKLGLDPKAKTNKFYLRFNPLLSRFFLWLDSATTRTGALGKRLHGIQSQQLLKTKDSQVFLQTGTNNFDEFEDCYLRG